MGSSAIRTLDLRHEAKFDPNAKIAVKLLRSLYKLWQEHLAQKLRSLGAEAAPVHPSNWLFWFKGELLVLSISVDDLSLAGRADLHRASGSICVNTSRLSPKPRLKMELGFLAETTLFIAVRVKQPLLLTCAPLQNK